MLVPCYYAADEMWGMSVTIWSRIVCILVCYLNSLRYKYTDVTFCQLFCGGVKHEAIVEGRMQAEGV